MNLKRRDAESSSIDARFEISELSQEKSTVPVLSASSAEKRARVLPIKNTGGAGTHTGRAVAKQLDCVASGRNNSKASLRANMRASSVGAASRVRVVVHKPEQIVLAE